MGSYKNDSCYPRRDHKPDQVHMQTNTDKFIRESFRQNSFWLRIMQEHALFIRLGLPCDETALIREAQRLEDLFKELRAELRRLPHKQEAFRCFNNEVIQALGKIIDYKSTVLERLITCNLGGSNLP